MRQISFVLYDYECYRVRFDGLTIALLFKNRHGYWRLYSEERLDHDLEVILVQAVVSNNWKSLREAKQSIRNALLQYDAAN